MARGWESKSVEAQQEERDSARKAPAVALTPAEAAQVREQQRLRLALARAEADLAAATLPAHRHMLEAAVTSLRRQLQ